MLNCIGECRDVPFHARAHRVRGAEVPGAAGLYRDIRASTELARLGIGLDQSAKTRYPQREIGQERLMRNVTVTRCPFVAPDLQVDLPSDVGEPSAEFDYAAV